MFARAVRASSTIPKPNFGAPITPIYVARSRHFNLLHSSAFGTMATGSKVDLQASQKPQYYVNGLRPESAEKASQLLQTNHEEHHIFFNQSGFHVR